MINAHRRDMPADAARVGALIDTLASRNDRLWPHRVWPAMKFDRELGVGAKGGHGPVRYFVELYNPGKMIRFRFTGPTGFDGYHEFEVAESSQTGCQLRHTLAMQARGLARFTWPMVFRPLHDALIEDSLSVAERSLGLPGQFPAWSIWVRILRQILARARARSQSALFDLGAGSPP